MNALRFFALILGAVICIGMALLTVHFWGLGQNYVAYDNKFLQVPGIWLVTPWDRLPSSPISGLIVSADVYRSDQGLLLVAPTSESAQKRDRKAGASLDRPTLRDFLQHFSQGRLMINATDNVEGIHQQMADLLNEVEGEKLENERLMIQSDYNTVLISLKELLPRLVYGSTPADTMRFKSYGALGVLSAVPFKGDVFVSPLYFEFSPTSGRRKAFTAEMGEELHRRLKKIFLGPVHSEEEAALALGLGADALLTDKPEQMSEWLKARK